VRLQGDGGPALLRWNAQQTVTGTVVRRIGQGSRLAAVALVALLAGCSLFEKKDTRACPRVEIVSDLSRLVKFRPGPTRDLNDVLYTARFDDVKTGCTYDKTGVTVEMTVSLRGERGRAGLALPTGDVTYFVAITDRNQNIAAKQNFTSQFTFPDKGTAAIDDELVQRIPLRPTAPGSDHTLILGFQLTPEEIDFNAKNRGG
jgi:hypothetical protein